MSMSKVRPVSTSHGPTERRTPTSPQNFVPPSESAGVFNSGELLVSHNATHQERAYQAACSAMSDECVVLVHSDAVG